MTGKIASASHAITMSFCLVSSVAAQPFDPDTMIDLEKTKPRGTWEEVTWPDTLDLSDRARIALEGALTLNPDPAHHLPTPMYRRDAMKEARAPTCTVKRFIANDLPPLP